MSSRGYTTKPCHGCGSTGEHPKDKVCSECEVKFKHAEQFNKLIEEDQDDDRIAVEMPDSWCHPNFFPKRMDGVENYDYDTIGKLLRDVAKSLATKTPKGYYIPSAYSGYGNDQEPQMSGSIVKTDLELFINRTKSSTYDHNTVVIMKHSTYELLEKLHDAIYSELLVREEEGFKYGKNLLAMLNDGEITQSEFLEKTEEG